MILAAGFGTRLWPLTEDRTKASIPFLNRPLITYSVDYLVSHGIRDIVVNLHHEPESIRNALEDGSPFGARIQYSYEEEILGTSGALDRVRDYLIEDDFVVINGKIVTEIDLEAAIRAHRERNAIATLILKENVAREHFSIVEVDPRGCIARFAGFPEQQTGDRSEQPEPPLMFTGIQVLSPRIFGYIPRNRFSHSTLHVYPRAIEAGQTVLGHVTDGNWYEMSTLDRYLEASLLFMRKQGRSVVEGKDCRILEGATVYDAVLWDRVEVGRAARIRNAVIGDDVSIPAGAKFDRAVIVRRDRVGEVERGEVVGENVVVPL
jgi:NDP-sugar pyrophosphorylase family protein